MLRWLLCELSEPSFFSRPFGGKVGEADVNSNCVLLNSGENDSAIYVDKDTRIQVLDSMNRLPRADKEQCGAFIVSTTILPLSLPPCPYTHTSPR